MSNTGIIDNSKPSWLRIIGVKFYSHLTPDLIIYGNLDNPTSDQLNITITGDKKIASAQNTCTITITNLTYEDIIKLTMGEYYSVEVYAGYALGDVYKIFTGEVAYISQKLNNHQDTETIILCASRLVAQYTQRRLKLQLNSGINIYTALKYITNKANIKDAQISTDLQNKFIENAISVINTPKDLLELIGDQAGLEVTADTSNDQIVNVTTAKDKRQIKINPNTISFLRGNPKISSTGLDIYLLPTFDFQIGDIIIIDQSLIDVSVSSLSAAQKNFNTNYLDTTLVGTEKANEGQGMYMIKDIDFLFQNRGQNFYIHINARAISLLYGDN